MYFLKVYFEIYFEIYFELSFCNLLWHFTLKFTCVEAVLKIKIK